MKRLFLKHLRLLASVATLVSLATSARADWDPTDPAKWYQLPDLQNGMDVYDTFAPLGGPVPFSKILADDFLCTQSGPITDIHLWGSWLNNHMPQTAAGDLISPLFHLSIHADVPKSPTNNYSHPGDVLWQIDLLPSQMRLYASNTTERFYNPNLNQVIGFDSQVWQYNFSLDPTNAFSQKQGTIYWLDVQVQPQPPVDPQDGPYLFGWKTSNQHFNDDAVYADNITFGGPPIDIWRDMHDPATGLSLDMAFVLTTTVPEPGVGALLGGGFFLLLARRRATIRQ